MGSSGGFFENVSLDHPGWNSLLKGIAEFTKRHPIGCGCDTCDEYQKYHERCERQYPMLTEEVHEVLERFRDRPFYPYEEDAYYPPEVCGDFPPRDF